MKNFAKTALFFSILFIAFLFVAIVLRFFASWIDLARVIPVEVRTGEDAAEAAWKAIPPALYFSILLTLSYTVRKHVSILSAICSVIFLAFTFSIISSIGISRTEATKTVFKPVSPIRANPGLIVSQGENSVILLRESSDVSGPRLVSIPGRPLIYQEVPAGPNNSILPIPAISFEDDIPWFIKSIGIDFSLSARELKSRFEGNILYFASYAFSLILLLSSMRSLLELSQWPLANVFLGALIFRLILALETIINSRDINVLLGSFIGSRIPIPSSLITPLAFCVLGTIFLLHTLLTEIARSNSEDSER